MRSPFGAEQEACRAPPPAGPPTACPCRPPSLLGDRLGHLLVVVGGAGRPGQDRPLVERQRRVGHDQLGVDLHLRPEAGAARAGAVRRVEGEHPRLELRHRRAAVQAGEALGVGGDLAAVHHARRRRCPRPAPRRSRSSRPGACAGRGRMTSRSTTTAMSCLNFLSSSMSSSSRRSSPSTFTRVKPSARSSSKQLAVLALAPAHDRRQHHEARALVERHHLVHDLLGRLGGDRPAAVVAVRMADPGPQQAQVVVDLGDRADRRARVARGGLLVDRDGRRQALDRVDVGLVHLPQELPRVGGQRLRRSGAGPRRRSCRRQGSTCPSRRAR